jgi:hypothetical protein
VFNDFFFGKKVPFFEIMWKNIVEPDRPQTTVWRMRIACWITNATDPQSMLLLLLFNCNDKYAKRMCYIIRTLPISSQF